MIRNVVLVRLMPDHDPAALEDLMTRFRRLDGPGMLAYTVGADLHLRAGGWSLAIVADFVDVACYRHYDADEEHNRLRGLLAPMAEEVARVQFEVP